MKKPTMALTAVLILLAFLTSCITAPLFVAPVPANEPAGTIAARIFPEVALITEEGRSFVGKVICIKGDNVEFHPSPYWNVEPLVIPLDDIQLLRLPKKSGGAAIGRGFLNGFGFFYTTIGVAGAASSKFNNDYSLSWAVSAVAGFAGGILGAIIGAVASTDSAKEMNLHSMAKDQKAAVLGKIMGR